MNTNYAIPTAALGANNDALSTPVDREVQEALDNVLARHLDELNDAVSRFGLGIYDLLPVRFRRIIRANE